MFLRKYIKIYSYIYIYSYQEPPTQQEASQWRANSSKDKKFTSWEPVIQQYTHHRAG